MTVVCFIFDGLLLVMYSSDVPVEIHSQTKAMDRFDPFRQVWITCMEVL